MLVKAGRDDITPLAGLAVQLWPDNSIDGLIDEFGQMMRSGTTQFFLAFDNGIPIGFAQCQLRRDYVEGTSTSPVGYLEGIFVQEAYRGKGYGRALAAACEAWAGEQGCSEFASDCGLGNSNSLAFHKAIGFEEAGRIICFTKRLKA